MARAGACRQLAALCIGLVLVSSLAEEADQEDDSCLLSHRSLLSYRRKRSGMTLPYVLQAYCGPDINSCSEVPVGWEVHSGAYDKDGSATPCSGSLSTDSSLNYVELGGDGVSGTIPTSDQILTWMDDCNADNVDFDMEGYLDKEFSTVQKLAQEIKSSKPSAKIQITCLGSTYDSVAAIADDFDYVSIMLHGNTMSSNGWDIPPDDPASGETYTMISDWAAALGSTEKIVFGLTTDGLEAYMVDWFKSLIQDDGYAGMSFWEIGSLDSSIQLNCIDVESVQCDGASACTQACASGDALGQCCETDSTTTYGSCSSLGIEGCCGDSSGANGVCQKVSSSTTTTTTATTTGGSCGQACASGDAKGQCCESWSTTSLGSCAELGVEGCCGDSSGDEGICQKESCTQKCASGDAKGQCCNTWSMTTLGSCSDLGIEGCCGDSKGTEGVCQSL
eukprot:TRINITY_DN48482_c0_g1_i1.p1 TRINITY_DN48482_c0_g1~~TRINITY_DN48482_c0_g1_i1.p1  ORF type:complete len:466 (-),score=73.58 TRINITY_DN48482_c0_g1_i1:501-1847(-)